MSSLEKAAIYKRFFKTGKGEYGEGDKFLGVVVPEVRKLVKKYQKFFDWEVLEYFIKSEWHEERLLSLLVLVEWMEKKAEERERIKDFYVENLKYVNNWDLVDQSADKILGRWVFEKGDEKILEEMVGSDSLWVRRVGVMSSFWFIKKGKGDMTLKLVEKLLNDKEDLIHKACGWMLRELGKKIGEDLECSFLDKYGVKMPRTMLRYAIERFSDKKRKYYLLKK